MKSSKAYDFSLTAGGAFVLPVSGSYFRILTATGAIEVRGNFGSVPVLQGQGLKDQDFSSLTLIDKSGSANIGTIYVSDGSFVDDRITGEVSVIDGGKSRSISGAAFFMAGNITTTGATQPALQLFNPATSGKNISVKAAYLSLSTAQQYAIAFSNSIVGGVEFSAAGIIPKRQGAISMAKAYQYSNANPTVSGGYNGLDSGSMTANQLNRIIWQEPVILFPGQGLVMFGAATAIANITGGFEYLEESV